MPDVVTECKAVGRAFEDQVADKLKALGFEVYRNLYVPYNPKSDKYTEVDIVAIRGGVLITAECKCMSGTLAGAPSDKTWVWEAHGRTTTVANPFRQSWSHRRALEDNLQWTVHDIIVLGDGTQWDCEENGRVTHFAGLETMVNALSQGIQEVSAFDTWTTTRQLKTWANPSEDTKQKQLLLVHATKNAPAVEALKEHIGVPYYCVLLQGRYYYCYTDDAGRVWGTEKLEEAALYEHMEDAYTVAGDFNTGEVCTLELGYVEAVADLPNEMDELTPAEYAYDVGARPW